MPIEFGLVSTPSNLADYCLTIIPAILISFAINLTANVIGRIPTLLNLVMLMARFSAKIYFCKSATSIYPA